MDLPTVSSPRKFLQSSRERVSPVPPSGGTDDVMCRDGTQSLLRQAPAGESIDTLLEQAGGFGRCQARDHAPAHYPVLPGTASRFRPPAQAA